MSLRVARHDALWKKVPFYSRDDRFFLTEIFARFPVVSENFSLYSSLPSQQRIPFALGRLEHTPRTGKLRFYENPAPVSRGLLPFYNHTYDKSRCLILESLPKAPESILAHCAEGSEMPHTIFPGDTHTPWLRPTLLYHDVVEDIITDFKPDADITRAEKHTLGLLGLELLTEARHEGDIYAQFVFDCISIFERTVPSFDDMRVNMNAMIEDSKAKDKISVQQRPFAAYLSRLYNGEKPDLTHLARQGKDLDLLQMITQCARIVMYGHSDLSKEQTLHEMKEFWDYVTPKLKTRRGRAFFKIFNKHYADPKVQDFKACYKKSCDELHASLVQPTRQTQALQKTLVIA